MAAATTGLRLPERQRQALQATIAGDMAIHDQLRDEIAHAEDQLAAVLDETPAGVLTTLPGVSVVRASSYGAAIGDPARFPNAGAAYRLAGLVPTRYQSAGVDKPGGISREGRADARQAILELGRGLAQHEPDFAAYRARLQTAREPSKVIAVAMGRRAHRLAFAMMRDQTPYDPEAWRAGVTAGRSVMAEHNACQRDVATPPSTSTMQPRSRSRNPQSVTAA